MKGSVSFIWCKSYIVMIMMLIMMNTWGEGVDGLKSSCLCHLKNAEILFFLVRRAFKPAIMAMEACSGCKDQNQSMLGLRAWLRHRGVFWSHNLRRSFTRPVPETNLGILYSKVSVAQLQHHFSTPIHIDFYVSFSPQQLTFYPLDLS